jgi:membrane dipeptidase
MKIRPSEFLWSDPGTDRADLADGEVGWRYQRRNAQALGEPAGKAGPGLTRRSLLAAASLICAPIGAAAQDQPAASTSSTTPEQLARRHAAALETLEAFASVDIHSHAGALLHVGSAGGTAAFLPLAAPMKAGRLAVVCLAIVSDSPTHRVTPEGRIRPFREPEPGELYGYAQRGFERLQALVAAQNLNIITTAAGLTAARSSSPSAIVSAEGGDFLEGRIERVDEAHAQWQLRHLQLTHYRVNELGDIQTEKPVHGGLTPFGAEVIGRCNRLGIVVDVAHATYDLVKQAAAVTSKPLVLSHTSLVEQPRPRTRRISADHARVIASTGGVIGVWPVTDFYPDIPALAEGIGQMADIVGVDHVGLGTDMMGLVGASALPDYARLPELADALLQRFNREETQKILGGNYARVFAATLG